MSHAATPKVWIAVAIALLAMPLVSVRTAAKMREIQDIACLYERRAHAHWVHVGETGPEPALQDCEDR